MRKKGNSVKVTVQKTLQSPIPYVGIGPKTGQAVSVLIRPARPNTGIMFLRRDAPPGQGIIQAYWYDLVEPTMTGLISNKYGFSVGAIKPLVSVLRSFDIYNVVIEVDSPELPINSDSAQDIAYLLRETGTMLQTLQGSDLEN